MNYLRKASHFLLATIFTLPFFTTSSAQAQQVSDLDLIKLREQIRSWANILVCDSMTPTKEFPPQCTARGGGAGVHDSVLFSSILCYSGEMWACRNVVASKDANGGMWRSPQRLRDRVERTGENEKDARFSYDHLIGVLLFIVTEYNRGNVDSARNFANHLSSWIDNNKYLNNQFIICPIKKFPQDLDYCSLEILYRARLIRHVFDYVGANSPEKITAVSSVIGGVFDILNGRKPSGTTRYRLGDGLNPVLFFHVIRGKCSTAQGFQCHLAAVTSLILQETNTTGDIMPGVNQEFQENPFSLWVNNRRQSNDKIRLLTFKKCSEGNNPDNNYKKPGDKQWAWERNDSEEAWKKSTGWDCVAMINLITNGRQEASRRRGETSPPSPVTFPPVARPGAETFPNTSSIRFCNGNSKQQTLYIAYVSPVSDSGWQAHGWLPIPYAQCDNADLGIEYTGEVYIYAEDETGNSFIGRQPGQQKLFCVQSNKQQKFNIPRSDERAFDCAASINGEVKGVWMNPYAVKPGLNTFTFLDKDNRSR